MAQVYVSLGSNIEPHRHIPHCLQQLQKRFGELTVSTVYENEPIGFDGKPFWNLVVGFETDLAPQALADWLHRLEEKAGRVRGDEKFAARTLDADLLLYDDLVIEQSGLSLPRDEIVKYPFVLRPLAEIAPRVIHPTCGQTLKELWHAFAEKEANPLHPVDMDVDLKQSGKSS